jgi:hypothetical protein
MQTMVCSIQWGNMTLALDQPAFQEGYTHGRQYSFEDAWEEQRKEAGEETLTTPHLLGLIAVRDERGFYQLDDGCHKSAFPKGVEELLGVLAGYLSGPLHPETPEERTQRLSGCVLIEE